MFDPMVMTLVLIAVVFGCLAFTKLAADMVLMAALAFLLLSDTLSAREAFSGFSNPGVMTIAVLYVIAAGLQNTGSVQWVARMLLGMPKSVPNAQLRLFAPSAFLSAFMNNTAIVSMFIPAVQDWADRLNIPASKFLIPLSYATILGGVCTLIGTSTNLVVDGLLQTQLDIHLRIFDLAWVGLPIVFVGGAYLYFIGHRLLPSRPNISAKVDEIRQYSVTFKVEAGGAVDGKTVADAGLRNLRSGYLAELHRNGKTVTSNIANTVLQAEDELTFIGAPETAKELRRLQGVTPLEGSIDKLSFNNHDRCLVEVVIGPDFPNLDQSIKECKFRTHYDAVVLSVSRGVDRLPGKLGDIILEVGDTLLLETSEQFVEHYRYRRDFMLVSALHDSTPPDYSKAPIAMGIVAVMVMLSAMQLLTMLEAGLLAAGAMVVTRSVNGSKARRSIDTSVLVVIAASFALGLALDKTGGADWISGLLLPLTTISPLVALIVIYVLTVILTELITNNAAAIMMFPIAVSVAAQSESSVLPFAIALMVAASASFITPLGYQTNLMVYGPGQYRFTDYMKIGIPLSILVGITALSVIPVVWPF